AIQALPPSVAGAVKKSAAAAPTDAEISAALQPPDGKWLVDKEGRQYFVTPAPRVEGSYVWGNEDHTKVRLPYGLTFDAASYAAKNFYVKISGAPGPPQPPPVPRRTPEALAKAAESYKFALGDSRRLAFEPFEGGLPTHGQWRNGFVVADMNG